VYYDLRHTTQDRGEKVARLHVYGSAKRPNRMSNLSHSCHRHFPCDSTFYTTIPPLSSAFFCFSSAFLCFPLLFLSFLHSAFPLLSSAFPLLFLCFPLLFFNFSTFKKKDQKLIFGKKLPVLFYLQTFYCPWRPGLTWRNPVEDRMQDRM
jgi:hypothetical protein